MTRPDSFDFARSDDDWAAKASRERDTPSGGVRDLARWAKKLRFAVIQIVQGWGFWPMKYRAWIVRHLGYDISAATYIADGVYFKGPGLVTEGSVFINTGAHIDAVAEIRIEDGARIACEAMLLSSSHEIGPAGCRAGTPTRTGIVIGRGSWIGARAMIMPGVRIAPGCIIAAGAIVTRDTKADGIYAGAPAKRIRKIGAEVHHLPTQPVEAVGAVSLT